MVVKAQGVKAPSKIEMKPDARRSAKKAAEGLPEPDRKYPDDAVTVTLEKEIQPQQFDPTYRYFRKTGDGAGGLREFPTIEKAPFAPARRLEDKRVDDDAEAVARFAGETVNALASDPDAAGSLHNVTMQRVVELTTV